MEKLLVIFFIIVIALTVVSALPSKSQTGQLITPSKFSIETSVVLILLSIIVITFIIIPKKHYNPVPYMLLKISFK